MALSTHRFLRDHSDEIVRVWEASVEGEARDVTLTGLVLRDHVPDLLKELADWMETANERDAGVRMHATSVAHAAHRLEHGFELAQFIDEVRLLRKAILSLLLAREGKEQEREGGEDMEVRVIELAHLNMGLDFAIAEGVEWFVNERERRLHALADRDVEIARESAQRKSDFLAVLSHELRNPLAPIQNGLYVLDRAAPGSESARRAREVVHRQTSHLTKLVDDLMDSTRLSHGKIELHRECVDLRALARSTVDDHREVLQQHGISVSLEVAPGPVPVDGDPIRIEQVLSNLIQNTVKFTPVGGRVSISIEADDGHARMRVRDDGVGMDENVVEHAFEAFVQARQDVSRQQGGLGLGLALVKGLVELHGGSVSARSAGVGRGSEFLVELPLAAQLPAFVSESRAETNSHASRLILIIEDNVDAGDALAQMLELSGHRTRIARDGLSGIALAREMQPDVVLCDIGLPDMNGYEVARELRADEGLSNLRLVAVTGYAQSEDRQRATQAGFHAHLAKPATLHDLEAVLAH